MIVRSTLKCLCKVGGVIHLAPGNNVIREDIAARLVETKDFKAKVAGGILVVIQEVDKEQAKTVAEEVKKGARVSPVARVNVAEAAEAIARIQDVNQLQEIIATDPRAGVKKAAEAKIEEIRKAMEDDAAKNQGNGDSDA